MPAGGVGSAGADDDGADGGDATILGPNISLTPKVVVVDQDGLKAPNPGGCGGGAAGPGPDTGGSW